MAKVACWRKRWSFKACPNFVGKHSPPRKRLALPILANKYCVALQSVWPNQSSGLHLTRGFRPASETDSKQFHCSESSDIALIRFVGCSCLVSSRRLLQKKWGNNCFNARASILKFGHTLQPDPLGISSTRVRGESRENFDFIALGTVLPLDMSLGLNGLVERFSVECRKTKVITLASHKEHTQYSEPIKTPSNYMQLRKSAGKRVRVSQDWFWFYFWLDEKVARIF